MIKNTVYIPDNIKTFGTGIAAFLITLCSKSKTMYINCKGKLIDLTVPKVMGILNVTPDSFFDGGNYTDKEKIEQRIINLIDDGADIIDIGAISTRPGSVPVSEEEEWKRLLPALELVRDKFDGVCFSLDTFRSTIAGKAVLEYGIGMVNDISAGDLDTNMFDTIKKLNVPYIIMHMQGTPETMQKAPHYDDVTLDIIKYFSKKTRKLFELGVNDIIIDPGFGFGKTLEHNYELLDNLEKFKILELPLLVGISRKSMIYKLLQTTPQQVLNGTTVLNTVALLKGAHILRVHDVKEAKEAIMLTGYLKHQTNQLNFG